MKHASRASTAYCDESEVEVSELVMTSTPAPSLTSHTSLTPASRLGGLLARDARAIVPGGKTSATEDMRQTVGVASAGGCRCCIAVVLTCFLSILPSAAQEPDAAAVRELPIPADLVEPLARSSDI